MGGAGSGDSAAAALECGAVSSVDVNGDDDGKRRINFESGIASMPSPNWYSSTHLTVGLVRDFDVFVDEELRVAGALALIVWHNAGRSPCEEVYCADSSTLGNALRT